MKTKKRILVSVLSVFAIAFTAFGVNGFASVSATTTIDPDDVIQETIVSGNLFEAATISDTNYINYMYHPANNATGTVGAYVSVSQSNVRVNTMDNMAYATDDISDALSYAGAKLTLSGTTTLDLGVVNLASSSATDLNALIGVVPSVNFLGPKTPADSTTPYIGMYYTFRSTVNPDKYFEIAMRQQNGNYNRVATGVSYNGTNVHYGQANRNAPLYWSMEGETDDTVGLQSYRFDGSMPVKNVNASGASSGISGDGRIIGKGGASNMIKPYCYNHPVKIYYDYSTKKFYINSVDYNYYASYTSSYKVTASDSSDRFLLFDASIPTEGVGYGTGGSYKNWNTKKAWVDSFTAEEAASVAVTLHVDWNPDYTGTTDIILTDFAGQAITTANASALSANQGTVGVLKSFEHGSDTLSLADGHKIKLSDNDLFTKLVSFEVYPEKVGNKDSKGTNDSGLYEIKMSFTDGTDTLDIRLKDFLDNDTYRNCYTLSVNGEDKWALGFGGGFDQSEYGFPIPYHFDRLVRYPASMCADQNYDRNASNAVYNLQGTSTCAFNIYYNAADNCLYADVGRDNSSTYITTTNAASETVRRWKIGDLGSDYSSNRTAFAGFGDNLLDFTMTATRTSDSTPVKIRLLELDGQKLSTDANGKILYNNVWATGEFYAPTPENGITGQSYTLAKPSIVQSTITGLEEMNSGYTVTVKNPSDAAVALVGNSFTPSVTGVYTATYTYSGDSYVKTFEIFTNTLDKEDLADNFTAVGDVGDYVNSVSYGDFTATNFSGGGVMVETRNKAHDLVNNTDTSNDTNPPLLNFNAARYPVGVTFDGIVDISDNTASTTLIELAFPGVNDNWQARGFKVMISDASNAGKYIALFIWGAWGTWNATGGNARVAAAATWEKTTVGPDVYINDAGYDDGSVFTKVSDVNGGDGFIINDHGTDINLSRTSANTVKVQFDNATGKLYVNGVLVRSFSDVAANGGDDLFEGFTDDQVKLTVGVVRTTKRSTDEFTRFCIMNIDGNNLAAVKSGSLADKVLYNDLSLSTYRSITDTATSKIKKFRKNAVINVHDAFTVGDKQPVGYMVSSDLHDINELNAVTMNENKSYSLVYADFHTESGAYIRVSSYTGIRFKGIITGGLGAALDGSEYGILVAPTDYIENKDFTVEDYVAGSMLIGESKYNVTEGGNTVFYITVKNIQAKNMARAFSARAYLKVTFYDGNDAYFYANYSAENNSRSAYEVAKVAYNGDTTAEEKTFLQTNYINKVVEINELGEKACDSASYTISSVSFSGEGDIIYLTVSGANGARCLVYNGAAYGAGSGTVPAQTNLAMYEDGGNLMVAFKLPTRGVSVLSQGKNVISGGSTAYSILVPKNASASELYAAQELQTILEDSYAVTLPITSEYEGASSKVISLGNTQFKKDANVTLDAYAAKQGGFRIKSFNNGVAIYAEEDYALYYGVYRFLEENFGYKYYAYDCQVINSGSTQPLKAFDYEDFPDIRYRSMQDEVTRAGYHVGNVTITDDTLKAAYINMHLYDTCSKYTYNDTNNSTFKSVVYGDGIPPFSSQLGDLSLLDYFLPYDNSWDHFATGCTYGAEHPSWYVVESGVVKQICFSKAYNNDNGMFDIIKDKLTYVISANPSQTIFEIGIGDNSSYCTCSACNSGYSTYGRSGVYLRFVNKLADYIKSWQAENCPTREIYLMAYAYKSFTVAPKNSGGVVAADNVIVRICPLTADYSKSLNNSSNTYTNSAGDSSNWQAIFNDWKGKAKHLAVWDYRSDFYDMLEPFPFWKQLENNVEFYKKCGVMEVYSQGIGAWSSNVLFPFAEMDDYIRSRMLWDTSLSYTTLRDEFIDAYYGAAGTYVKNYISKIDTAFGSSKFTADDNDANSSKYSSSWVSTVKGYFDSAYAAVSGNAEITRRLDYLSLFYRYLQIKLSYSGADKTTFKAMCADLGIVYVERGVTVASL